MSDLQLTRLQGHTALVRALCVCDDGLLVSGGDDNSLRVWDAELKRCVRVLEGHVGEVTAIAPLRGGRLLSASTDRTLRLWTLASGRSDRQLVGHNAPVLCCAAEATPAGEVVSGSADGSVRLWGSLTGESALAWEAHTAPVTAVRPLQRSRLATASDDGSMRVWRLAPGKAECELRLRGHGCVSHRSHSSQLTSPPTQRCRSLPPRPY